MVADMHDWQLTGSHRHMSQKRPSNQGAVITRMSYMFAYYAWPQTN